MWAEQLRAARALLRWEQKQLAEAAGVSIETIKRLERMSGEITGTKPETIEGIEFVLYQAGVRFLKDGYGDIIGGPGVRIAKATPEGNRSRILKRLESGIRHCKEDMVQIEAEIEQSNKPEKFISRLRMLRAQLEKAEGYRHRLLDPATDMTKVRMGNNWLSVLFDEEQEDDPLFDKDDFPF